ncbi:hypothetical protein GUITHDRAFT_148575 [Guillardia theta CCMP2712]|uniref:Uncharacterized protein n=1 Tax=Guillardia theta (strain CCMP2712) TaxID=905079 RepID=L1I9J3_GUITC|nr:hypothetical protein GUITHDRAFT_148575 [Guillardia theta CCMP2712]EKX32525.1 hypothetical protein GUITHDRAFT_148575 [Guillardia theta CCMP2712]|eukprot:XP_005819505.1 hypothetical protein GUITHDRAFT_148575 [Guillardia theta CCMP2712]
MAGPRFSLPALRFLSPPPLPPLSVLLLLLLLSHNALAADYGQLCYSAEECRSEEAPYCQYFFTDNTYKFNTQSRGWSKPADETRPRKFGLCVQCISDCDCGVNEYCGIDNKNPVVIPYNLTSNNTGTGLTPGRKLRMMVYAKQFEGLPLRSKCKSYDLPKSNCDTSLDKSAYQEHVFTSVQVANTDDPNNVTYQENRGTPLGWPKEAEAFLKVVDLSSVNAYPMLLVNKVQQHSSAVSTRNLYNTPATCVPYVIVRNTSVCPSCLYRDGLCMNQTDRFCCEANDGFNEATRQCSVDYRSCEGACQPPTQIFGVTFSKDTCTAPGGPQRSDEKTYCRCLASCKECVANSGGCSSDTAQGQCKLCTAAPTPPPPSPPPPPPPAITDGYQCDAPSVNAQQYEAYQPPSWGLSTSAYCQPACVDCLVTAARYGCTTSQLCGDIKLEVQADGSCSTTGEFRHEEESFSFHFVSPPIDYTGHCTQTDCKICLDGQERCTATDNKGHRQTCISNEWVSWTSKEIKQPAVDVGSRALIAIAVFTAITFLAVLLVTASIMNRISAQQRSFPAPLPEQYGGKAAAFVQTPGNFQQTPAPLPAPTPAPAVDQPPSNVTTMPNGIQVHVA